MTTDETKTIHRRLAAVWFADLVGFTRLAGVDEDTALASVRALQEAAKVAAEDHGGRIVKFLGDGAMAEFPSAHGAVASALDLSETIEGDTGEEPRLRVGIHAGEIATGEDGDVYGDDVNLTARIQTAAEPGQVVASDAIARQLRRRRTFAFDPLGARSFKGVSEPVAIFSVRRMGEGERPAPPEAAPARSIAVLPFANLSADPENEYFSDGVTEEILTSLARIEELKVISRTSVMRYKGTSKSVREIGAELGVATVLEGSVRRAGGRVRITAQLIDARTDEHLWVDRYDRELEDIFEIQSDVAERIVEALHVFLTPREKARAIASTPTDQIAYHAYLKGLSRLARREPRDLRAAVQCFERAVEVDPDYAPAWAGSAMAWVLQLHWGPHIYEEARARGLEAAERTLDLDPGLGTAHAARAQVRIFDLEWDGAEADLDRAVELAPGDANARQWRAEFLACMGRFDQAFAEIRRARELDPLSLAVATEEGNVALLAGRVERAEGIYRRAIDLDPTFRPARYKLFELLLYESRWEEAIEQLVLVGERTPEEAETVMEEVERTGPEALLDPILELSGDLAWSWCYRAIVLSLLGRLDEAYEALDRSVETGDWYLVRIAVTPFARELRQDPRFLPFLDRIGLADVAGRARAGEE
ncbi:MAG: adenylate/guanylate cyclase domain-containing protein [Gemmatimonadota bacterium]|nr:adenylate/guanylate cyclase domain-containing protein [Gemmatimonadota bacterium]